MNTSSIAIPLIAAIAGSVVGTLLGGRSVLPDFFERLRWSWNGGGGESAEWGEPLFYLLLLGMPIGLLCCIGAFVVVALVQWIARKRE